MKDLENVEKKFTREETIGLVKKIWVYIRKYKKLVVIILILTTIMGAFQILYSLFWAKGVVNLTKNDFKQFILYFGFFAILWVIHAVFILINNYLYSRLERNFIVDMKQKMYEKVLNVGVNIFDNKKSGEIINKVSLEPNVVLNNLNQIFKMFVGLVTAAGFIIFISILCPLIGMYYLIALIIIYISFKTNGVKTKKIQKSIRKSDDKVVSILNQSIQGIREVKGLGIKESILSRFVLYLSVLRKKQLKNTDIQIRFIISISIVRLVIVMSVFITGGWYVYTGKLALEYFLLIDGYTWVILQQFEQISYLSQLVQGLNVSLSRIFEVLDDDVYTIEKFGDNNVEKLEGQIEFKDLSFSYDTTSKVLENVNIHIPKNKKIAIVGKSGSGKSTLFNLLLRFYECKEGEILIDGINIKEFNEDSLRKHISVIRQEPFLFNSTIKENLAMVKSGATFDEIRESCKIAYIDEYIMSLPKQYDTLIGEGGVNLSGGQKQRIAIARAMLKKSKIMLFDEATSALDNESQYNVKKAIDEVAKDHTVIIIAHRLSTVIDCDEMILLDDGKVVARGTHDDLIKNNEVYGKLYNVDLING
ncbi:MAG TPA: ABC transporter ATP-binding protein [Clostridiales bacterium]|nr:ABC transporter ATP-binding protein [Clostridiales bacterium]